MEQYYIEAFNHVPIRDEAGDEEGCPANLRSLLIAIYEKHENPDPEAEVLCYHSVMNHRAERRETKPRHRRLKSLLRDYKEWFGKDFSLAGAKAETEKEIF